MAGMWEDHLALTVTAGNQDPGDWLGSTTGLSGFGRKWAGVPLGPETAKGWGRTRALLNLKVVFRGSRF